MVDDPKQVLREFKEEFHIMPAGYPDRQEEGIILGKKHGTDSYFLIIPVFIILFFLVCFRK